MISQSLLEMTAVNTRRIVRFLALSLLVTAAMSQSLPYNPTSIFLSQVDADIAYVFLPSTTSPFQSQLATINISSTLQSSSLSAKTLSTSLPFEDGDNAGNTTAYLPYMSASGSIGVYAGSCKENPSMWMFSPNVNSSGDASTDSANGRWDQMAIIPGPSISSNTLTSANFLASAFSFSTSIDSNDTHRTIYTFGGMCPTSGANESSWQSAASYSNNMLRLTPTTGSTTSYDLSVTASVWNRPIPEAGFTITGLTPTYSNTSDGIVPQAQNFVLIGGHTKAAFTNMSLIALFSMPQESWSFQAVDPPGVGGSTELAVKSTAPQTPDSRSGHTAVLSPDGTAIIICGGWVGDVNTPADPQLAVLRLGSGFGGSGDWQWEIPTTTGTGFSSGEGIYGHGAVMLPGHVMMIIGGNTISTPTSKKVKRGDSGPRVLFLNTTSLSWISEYTNPLYVPDGSEPSGSSSTSSNTGNAKKVGLGVGLGLGLTAIIGAFVVYYLYARRLKKRQRHVRERDLQALSQSASYYMHHGAGMTDQERELWWQGVRGGEMAQTEGLMFGSSATNLGNKTIGSKNHSYGALSYIPTTGVRGFDDDGPRGIISSTLSRSGSIPRKPVTARNARGYYQPAPISTSNEGWNHGRANSLGTAGPIHPIYEADEDIEDPDEETGPQLRNGAERVVVKSDGDIDEAAIAGQAMFNRAATILRYSTTSDPFRDPSPVKSTTSSRPGTSHSQTPDRSGPSQETAAQDREREISEWVADWAAADAMMNSRSGRPDSFHSGRLSPTKDSYRTESNLSEKSLATMSAVGLSRNSSLRSNAFASFFAGSAGSWNPFSVGGTTALGLGSINENGHQGGDVSPVSHTSSAGKPPPSAGSGTSSFTTAHTTLSFPQMRAEGESLLPRPPQEHEYIPDGPGSPSKSRPIQLGRQPNGWLGTLKRVFSSTDGQWSAPGSSSGRSSPRRNRSPSIAGSPTRASYAASEKVGSGAGVEPRRTASASAVMWRRKQGPGDWEDSVDPGDLEKRRERSNTLTHDGMRPSLDEEWDIERAIERRVVQVMFTVPKERLRVVNADADTEDKSDAGSIFEKENEAEKERQKQAENLREKEKELLLKESLISESAALSPSPSPSRPGSPGKLKGRVQEIVEKMESGSI